MGTTIRLANKATGDTRLNQRAMSGVDTSQAARDVLQAMFVTIFMALLSTTVDNFGVAAETKEVQLSLEVPQRLPWVKADMDRIRQVLFNLLGNALRYTPQGGRIVLSALATEQVVRVTVADNGEGIAPEDLPHIFDRFYRGDYSRSRAQGGSGLGLAGAKAWVQALGGEIGVESTLGHGSQFWFTLPMNNHH